MKGNKDCQKKLESNEITKSELNKARKEATINVLLSAFGPVGTAIQESLFGIGDRIRNNRIENYLIELEPRLKHIENLSIPKKYYESIEFYEYVKNEKIDVYQFRLYCREIENKSLIRFSSNLNEIGRSWWIYRK